MIRENSGKFFRFKLDFGLGYGFAEVYDFSDEYPVDGNIVFVYKRIDEEIKKNYNSSEITSSGIGLGPITLAGHPNSRGVGAWKYLFKSDTFLIEERPITKDAQDLNPLIYNWDTLKQWHKSDWDTKRGPIYVRHNDVRSLETRIINSTSGVVKKTTMKKIIDEDKNLVKYYDLSELGNRNMFLQLINTYYSADKTEGLIGLISIDQDEDL